MRILFYGAGVIGSLYATLFSKAGFDVTVFARGRRLQELKEKGLLYLRRGKITQANVTIIDTLQNDDEYDFIFVVVRGEQIITALNELKLNRSKNIVTMANASNGYDEWENIVGTGRIIPAFPGAGGSINNGILDAKLTPQLIQPTTFGEVDGVIKSRTKLLQKVFCKSHVPTQIVSNMENWQLSHLALVVPIADAYYMAKDAKSVYRESDVMKKTAVQLKQNFTKLAKQKRLSPAKFYVLKNLPTFAVTLGLKITFKSKFGDLFMYRHAIKATDEMRQLHDELYAKI